MGGTWVKNPTPVLVGDGGPVEQNCVSEPLVLHDPTGIHQLRMFYSSGWIPATISAAVSDDGGLTWTREAGNPVIGQGAGGVATSAQHTGLVIDGNTLHIIFTNPDSGTTTLQRVTSTDGGLTWANPVSIMSAAGWESGRWGNTAAVIVGGVWHLLYEAMDSADVWQMGYATSPDGLTFTRGNGGNPLRSLQHAAGGMYGGPDLHLRNDGTWELFYHASPNGGVLPTNVYRAVSADLISWIKSPATPILAPSLAFEVDQVADTHVLDVDGQRVMFYAAMDNPNAAGRIGRAVLTPE